MTELIKQRGILKTLRNYTSSIDFYATPVQLTIAGQTNSKSVFGALVTLGVFLGTIAMSFNIFLNIIQEQNPSISFDT